MRDAARPSPARPLAPSPRQHGSPRESTGSLRTSSPRRLTCAATNAGSGKSKGKIGVLTAKLVDDGIQFPDSIVWKKFDATDSSAAVFEGAFTDPMYPRGWRTIVADGVDTAVVVGLDASVGTAWWSPGKPKALPLAFFLKTRSCVKMTIYITLRVITCQ